MLLVSILLWMLELCCLLWLVVMFGLVEFVVVVLVLVLDGSCYWIFGELLLVSGFVLWLVLVVIVSFCLLW